MYIPLFILLSILAIGSGNIALLFYCPHTRNSVRPLRAMGFYHK